MEIHFSWAYLAWGALGGFASMLLSEDGGIELPSLKKGKIYLGGLSGILLGAVAGMIADTNPANAVMWGVAGGSGLKKLLGSKTGMQKEGISNENRP